MSKSEGISRIYQPLLDRNFDLVYRFDADSSEQGVMFFYLDNGSMQLSSKYDFGRKVANQPTDLSPGLLVFSRTIALFGSVVGMDLPNLEKMGFIVGKQSNHVLEYRLDNLKGDVNDDAHLFRFTNYGGRKVAFPNETFISRLYPLKP